MSKKIIDCFLFYTELDMLEYRLSVLNDYVDYFVLVEAVHTFSGKQKQLFFNENKQNFGKYKDKIIHLMVYDMPFQYPNINYELNQQWLNEAYQRNCLKYGIDALQLKDNDVIIISDVDEIPDPQILLKIKMNDLLINFNSLEQDMYYYNLNSKHNDKWYFPKILNYKKYNEMGLTIHDIRMNFKNNLCVPLKNGGWHLSYFGTKEYIQSKIMNFSHQEFNTNEFTDTKKIEERMNKGIDLFNRRIEINNVLIEENTYLPPNYYLLTQEKTLIQLIDNTRTDKNTTHSYLELYEKLFSSKKKTAKNILEIGICHGGSIKLWSDYFVNANVHGLDIINIDYVWNEIRNKDKIILHTSVDAYDETYFIKTFLENNDTKFDMLLDDGPHTLESMKQFIRLYSQLMTTDGILIIEDVQSWDWIDTLKNEVPEHLKKYIEVYDLRLNKNRYDDIVFVINKNA
jgi:beta-1,4-mannosyl-glycoprotein beta-1,4-N-acetylglucosaminyltransferase